MAKLYADLMSQLMGIDSTTSHKMWQCLSSSDKQIWIGLDYSETMESYQDNGKPMKLKLYGINSNESMAKGIYVDAMESLDHTEEEATEMWESLSGKDKELLMLMTEGTQILD